MSAPVKKPARRSRLPVWRLYFSFVVAVLAGLAVWFYSEMSDKGLQVGVVALIAVVARVAVLALMGNPFGPILFYDLICTARRGRYVLIRCLYLSALLALLFLLWFS